MIIRKAKGEDAKGIAKVHVDSWRTILKFVAEINRSCFRMEIMTTKTLI